jgi:predicted nucleotidyltransferase component of viral defense system
LPEGWNLRFYFQSIRYSEDIDFDVRTTSVETLKKNVKQILEDTAFRTILKNTQSIEIVEWSAPKQTETTQRWKVSLRVKNQTLPIPTKIEFSRRSLDFSGSEIRQVNAQITTGYKLQQILVQHYMLPKAIEQKIGALISRTETQARDVIDLQILKNQLPQTTPFPLLIAEKTKALETLMSVSFDDYKSQVWPYLMTEYQADYGTREMWDRTQSEVVRFIEDQPVRAT